VTTFHLLPFTKIKEASGNGKLEALVLQHTATGQETKMPADAL
jgi:hypothetical protein